MIGIVIEVMGLIVVVIMVVSYVFEYWYFIFIGIFCGGCVLVVVYVFLIGFYLFLVVEGVWVFIVFRCWCVVVGL